MKKIVFTQQEIWNAMRHKIEKSKKLYTRKIKHKVSARKGGHFSFAAAPSDAQY